MAWVPTQQIYWAVHIDQCCWQVEWTSWRWRVAGGVAPDVGPASVTWCAVNMSTRSQSSLTYIILQLVMQGNIASSTAFLRTSIRSTPRTTLVKKRLINNAFFLASPNWPHSAVCVSHLYTSTFISSFTYYSVSLPARTVFSTNYFLLNWAFCNKIKHASKAERQRLPRKWETNKNQNCYLNLSVRASL